MYFFGSLCSCDDGVIWELSRVEDKWPLFTIMMFEIPTEFVNNWLDARQVNSRLEGWPDSSVGEGLVRSRILEMCALMKAEY
jgi:hypothetical protein